MARIPVYNAQVDFQGPTQQRRAHASDFFQGPTAEAANELGDAALILKKRIEADDIAEAHKSISEIRDVWHVALDERAKNAESAVYGQTEDSTASISVGGYLQGHTVGEAPDQMAGFGRPAPIEGGQEGTKPGNPGRLSYRDFAEKYRVDLADALAKKRDALQTLAGQRYFDTHAADLRSELGYKASYAQNALAGAKAVADYSRSLDYNRSTLMRDPTQFSAIMRESVNAIAANPEIPAGKREQLITATRKGLSLSAVQGEINMDPDAAVIRLKQGDWDEYLDADNKNALINHGIAESDRRYSKFMQMQNQLDREAEKAKKAESEDLFKDLYTRLPGNSPGNNPTTMAQIVAAQDKLEPGSYKTLIDKMAGGTAQYNEKLYSDLAVRSMHGEDVSGYAKQAYDKGDISYEMFNHLTPRTTGGPTWYKQGEEYIKMYLGGSSLTATGFERQNTVNALREWQEWSEKNPDAKRSESQAQLDDLLARYQQLPFDQITLTLPLPKYSTVKNRQELDDAEIGKAFQATEKAFKAGQITPEEYRREMKNLKSYSDAARLREKQIKKPGKGQ